MDKQVEGQLGLSFSSPIQAMMPSFNVVISTDGFLKNAPTRGGHDLAVDPGILNIIREHL